MSRTSVELDTFSNFVSNPSSQSLQVDGQAQSQRHGSVSIAQNPENEDEVSKATTAVVIASVTCITGISTLLAGLVTVGLPTMAKDLSLDPSLLLWYDCLSLRSSPLHSC